jgi:hypothetical protein
MAFSRYSAPQTISLSTAVMAATPTRRLGGYDHHHLYPMALFVTATLFLWLSARITLH